MVCDPVCTGCDPVCHIGGTDIGAPAKGQHSHVADARDATEVIDSIEGPRVGDPPGQHGAYPGQALELEQRRAIDIHGYAECLERGAPHSPHVEASRRGMNGVSAEDRPFGPANSRERLHAVVAAMEVTIDLEGRLTDEDGGRSGDASTKLAHQTGRNEYEPEGHQRPFDAVHTAASISRSSPKPACNARSASSP